MTKPIPHGTMNGYSNYRCRCDLCRAAWAAYVKRARRVPCANGCGELATGRWVPGRLCRACWLAANTIPLEACHGTGMGYKKGCRCAACTQASTEARRRARHANPEKQREYDRRKRAERKAAAP